ncbi:cation:proton antiporter [Crenobacter sp. SG2305]|uniref:cation:proton antiporter n=1 Tax=Crenobacter oryzisoli TaxID=3056844 RepID=UPI0025AB154C|nr:cation:proton antiporter [Crenobacter sp. SG2305]MDN0083475.1 cation:proton antiporter [Crenobacter sp. SG2305]
MHGADFLRDLAVIMLIAGATTVLFSRLRQPVVLGYILAGLIIGPHTPPYPLITNSHTIETLAEMGVVFLMFSLGLEFSLKKLREVGSTALVAALMEIVVMIWVGFEIGRFFGWRTMDSLFLGAMLAVSSTTIIVKALSELGLKHERFAQLVFGILIVEDILAIGLIALLSGIAVNGDINMATVGATLGKLGIFLVVSLTVGILVVPRLLAYVARFDNDEMLLVTVLGLCFGFCLMVIELGYSVALGAFVIGAIMAESRQLHLIERLIAPVRDMFSAIFFVAVGLMLDPRVLVDYWLPITVITVAVVLGKLVSCGTGAFLAGQSGRTSMRVGMGLAQIGEFSFIIAALGVSLKVTSDFLYPIAVAVSALTTLLTPYLIQSADPLSRRIGSALPGWLTAVFGLYTRWLGSLQLSGDNALAAAIVQRCLLQILVNLCLVAGVFLGLAALFESGVLAFLPLPLDHKNVLWGAAMLLSLPFLVACYRKQKALGQMLAEMTVRGSAGRYPAAARQIIAELVPLLGIGIMLLVISAVSGSLLPPLETRLVVLGVAVVAVLLLSRQLIRLHSRLQIALQETLETPPDPLKPERHGHH